MGRGCNKSEGWGWVKMQKLNNGARGRLFGTQEYLRTLPNG